MSSGSPSGPAGRGRLEKMWYAAEAPPLALRPLGALYSLAMTLRAGLYGSLFRVHKAARPVISFGNLTVGGTGKTPLCLWLTRALLAEGRRPAILSRGYGRGRAAPATLVLSRGRGPEAPPAWSGDEPWLLAAAAPEALVVVDAKRVRAAEVAVGRLGADVLLLDDGFQHLALAADCRILLAPGRRPFGNGAGLPAGPLREPLAAHRRAHLLVETGSAAPGAELLKLAEGRPVFAARQRLTGFRRLADGAAVAPAELSGRRLAAFCALGRPDGFYRTLAGAGLNLEARVSFRDHQPYGPAELAGLARLAEERELEGLLTTAKDAVKLSPDLPLARRIIVAEAAMELDRPDVFLKEVKRHAGL